MSQGEGKESDQGVRVIKEGFSNGFFVEMEWRVGGGGFFGKVEREPILKRCTRDMCGNREIEYVNKCTDRGRLLDSRGSPVTSSK